MDDGFFSFCTIVVGRMQCLLWCGVCSVCIIYKKNSNDGCVLYVFSIHLWIELNWMAEWMIMELIWLEFASWLAGWLVCLLACWLIFFSNFGLGFGFYHYHMISEKMPKKKKKFSVLSMWRKKKIQRNRGRRRRQRRGSHSHHHHRWYFICTKIAHEKKTAAYNFIHTKQTRISRDLAFIHCGHVFNVLFCVSKTFFFFFWKQNSARIPVRLFPINLYISCVKYIFFRVQFVDPFRTILILAITGNYFQKKWFDFTSIDSLSR